MSHLVPVRSIPRAVQAAGALSLNQSGRDAHEVYAKEFQLREAEPRHGSQAMVGGESVELLRAHGLERGEFGWLSQEAAARFADSDVDAPGYGLEKSFVVWHSLRVFAAWGRERNLKAEIAKIRIGAA